MAERRRGEKLNNAILTVSWELLQQVGYQNVTISEVAKQAKTNKNVLYRRWRNKAELIFAAIQQHVPEVKMETPNTGSLQGDLKELLGRFIPVLDTAPEGTWNRLLPELLLNFTANVDVSELIFRMNEANFITTEVNNCLANARGRGEAIKTHITTDQQSLPVLLLLNKIFLTGAVTQAQIDEIVDSILLPIYATDVNDHKQLR